MLTSVSTETALAIFFIAGSAYYVAGALSMRRSLAYLMQPKEPYAGRLDVFYIIVIPVLREQHMVRNALAHFSGLLANREGCLVIVTNSREEHERAADEITTQETLAGLQAQYSFVHLDYPHSDGLKGDQLNFAAEHFSSMAGGRAPESCFFLYFDADSRPSFDTIAAFDEALSQHASANVLQQCSRFVVRPPLHASRSALHHQMLEASALRANRFVLLYELPRIRRTSIHSKWRFWPTYAHVTGHGLGIRCSFALAHPFPQKTIMEDMYYGFFLNALREPVFPVRSLDVAEVPKTVAEVFRQEARWFAGPSRTISYFCHVRTRRTVRSACIAVIGLLISAQWLGCLLIPPLTALVFVLGTTLSKGLSLVFAASYMLTVVTAGRLNRGRGAFLGRVSLFPVCIMLFGLAGWRGLFNLCFPSLQHLKTERCLP
jgi:hypothetical protein